MGYYTTHRLKIFEAVRNQLNLFETELVTWSPDIDEAYKTNPGAEYALEEDGSPSDSVKWYDHDSDMIEFSKKYPDLVFQLFGEGEESGDIWCTYYHNGKLKTHKMPEWTPPKFDPKELI